MVGIATPQLAYQPKFEVNKIVYGHFSEDRIFAFDESGVFSNDKTYFIPNSDFELWSLLNSKSFWFVLTGLAPAVRGGWRELRVQYVEQLPIPNMPAKTRKKLAALGEACTKAARARYDLQTAVRRRILDLAPPERAKLTGRLENWHTLDFSGFRTEIKRAFRVEIPLKERGDWESYLAEQRAAVLSLSGEISAAEAEIDNIVYAVFELSHEEIALLEGSLDGQY